MKSFFILFFFINIGFYQNIICKKRILVLSSKGGGGHTCAANAIKNYLKNDYDINIINVFCEVFGTCDPIKTISLGYSDAEELYNKLLNYRFNFLINLYNYLGLFISKNLRSYLVTMLKDYVKKNKYDFLISIIPYINGIGLEVAEKLKIPFIVIPTDLNSENFAFDLKNTNYKKFNYVLPFKDELLIEKIKFANIPEDKIKFTGYPLREDFFNEKDVNEIKNQWDIPLGKQVVMILMGATGSTATYMYAYRLAKYKDPVHLILCLGRSGWLKDKIKKIKFSKNVTVTYVDYTNKISDLMAVSDLILTKTGTHSVCEAIQSKLPLLLDCMNPCLQWENLNPSFIKKHAFGKELTDYCDLPGCVSDILNDKRYKQNLLKKEVDNFPNNLKNLIQTLI